MVTQDQVNALQADLLAAEAALKAAQQAILDCSAAEPAVGPGNYQKLSAGMTVTLAGMKLFHDAAAACSLDAGITPLSGGGPK